MVVGGVAANRRLAGMLDDVSARQGCALCVVPIRYAGDCGSQIAWTGILESRVSKPVATSDAFVRQSWRLDQIDIRY